MSDTWIDLVSAIILYVFLTVSLFGLYTINVRSVQSGGCA